MFSEKTHLGIDSMDAVQRKSTFFAGKDAFSRRRLNNQQLAVASWGEYIIPWYVSYVC